MRRSLISFAQKKVWSKFDKESATPPVTNNGGTPPTETPTEKFKKLSLLQRYAKLTRVEKFTLGVLILSIGIVGHWDYNKLDSSQWEFLNRWKQSRDPEVIKQRELEKRKEIEKQSDEFV
jgi:hypothetical protein